MAASRARAFALAAQTGLGSEAMEQVYDYVRHVAKAYPQRPLPEILCQLVETFVEVHWVVVEEHRLLRFGATGE